GPADLRFLTGDRREVADRPVDQLAVTCSVAEAHVQHDLGQAGNLMRIAVAELLTQLAGDLLPVPGSQPRRGPCLVLFCTWCGHQISFPLLREIRTFLPSSSNRYPTRVALPSESTTWTFETSIGASWVMIPPDSAPRCPCVTRVCFLMRLTPSSNTRPRSGYA